MRKTRVSNQKEFRAGFQKKILFHIRAYPTAWLRSGSKKNGKEDKRVETFNKGINVEALDRIRLLFISPNVFSLQCQALSYDFRGSIFLLLLGDSSTGGSL